MNRITRGLSALISVAALSAGTVAVAAPAQALTEHERGKTIAIAEDQKGTPYVYGGQSPREGFDCAGFTQYVYGKSVGAHFGPTAGSQAHVGHGIPDKYDKKRGDLIIFYNGSGAYHTGIYAGNHKIWHASRPGEPVQLERLWTSSYEVRRLS